MNARRMKWLMAAGVARLAALPTSQVRVVEATPLPPPPRIFVCNHRSYYDPVIGLIAFARVGAHPSIGVSAKFFSSVLRPFLRAIGAVPVERGEGTALQQLSDIIASGGDVGLMVEGRIQDRSELGNARSLHTGAAVLSAATKAPIVVMAMGGTDRAWPRGRKRPILRVRKRPRCSVVFGPQLDAGDEEPSAVTARIHDSLVHLEGEALEMCDGED